MNKESLTGLLYFGDFREKAQELFETSEQDFFVISFNVYGFKYINQIYGYQKGDEFLKFVADYFCRGKDCVYATREYADHFFMVVRRQHYKNVEDYVIKFNEKVKDFVNKYSYLYSLAKFHISAGVYATTKEKINISEACDKAEVTRKQIKDNPNRIISVYSDDIQKSVDLELSVIPMFTKAVEDDRVLVFLQPKIKVDTGEIVGAEALVRILDEKGNIVSPAVIIPALEKSGMIYQLDLIVAEKVYKLIKKWMDNNIKPVRISVNLSRLDFLIDGLCGKVNREFIKYNIPNEYIEFEVTETAFVDDIDNVVQKVEELRNYGYKISMDDFGSGYSSLNAVGMLPVDVIKFDRGFIRNSIKTEKGQYVITKMVEMFELLGMEIICEGVETDEEKRLARACGCKYIQGYVYDKPLRIEDFEEKYMKDRIIV